MERSTRALQLAEGLLLDSLVFRYANSSFDVTAFINHDSHVTVINN